MQLFLKYNLTFELLDTNSHIKVQNNIQKLYKNPLVPVRTKKLI